MESDSIDFLPKPSINIEEMNLQSTKVYVNLYKIILTKELKLYQYPFTIMPELGEAEINLFIKIIKDKRAELKKIFKEFFISGDSLYSMEKVDQINIVKCAIYSKGRREYSLVFQKFQNEVVITQKDIHINPFTFSH